MPANQPPGMDIWMELNYQLGLRFGPRSNATYGCDVLRGTCLNISGLPIIEYDQNGTCTCHPWYSSGDCSQMILNNETCVGMPDFATCERIRDRLYFCGDVKAEDALPQICLEEKLTVVQCGEACAG